MLRAAVRRLADYLTSGTKPARAGGRQGGWLAFKGGGMQHISLTISSNQTSQYNIFTAAGSPTRPVSVLVTINAGVVLQAGLTTGSGWKSGSILKVVNHGTVAGTGGDGGAGATLTDGGNGFAGGDAIQLLADLSYDNTDGFIFGGGGGGGGGSQSTTGSEGGCGGGGGGGQGYNNAAGGAKGDTGNPLSPTPAGSDGSPGSSAGPGAGGAGGLGQNGVRGGNGGAGGAWATAGSNADNGTGTTTHIPGTGGAAGKAVALNGHTLTQVAGFDGPAGVHVKGVIA